MGPGSTRQQMIDTAVLLFQRHGYRATSWRVLVREAGAPWGSVQHHFPGGKEELGVAAIARAAELVESLLTSTFDAAADPADGVRAWFASSATLLDGDDEPGSCPVAPVALEMAADSPALAAASAAAFDRWVAAVAAALTRGGIEESTARSLAITGIATFEGALILARASGSTAPVLEAGGVLATMVAAHLPTGVAEPRDG